MKNKNIENNNSNGNLDSKMWLCFLARCTPGFVCGFGWLMYSFHYPDIFIVGVTFVEFSRLGILLLPGIFLGIVQKFKKDFDFATNTSWLAFFGDWFILLVFMCGWSIFFIRFPDVDFTSEYFLRLLDFTLPGIGLLFIRWINT